MSSSEYYQRAAVDASFRQHSLENLRLFKHFAVALMCLCGLAAVGVSVYGGMEADKWDSGYGLVIVAAFSWIPYLCCATRLAALEQMEKSVAPELR